MDLTMFLAQVVGVYLVVVGLSLVLYPKRTAKMVHEVVDDYLMPYLGASMSLIVGLVLVLVHNVWDDLASSLISLVGWSAIVKGALIFLLPKDSFGSLAQKLGTRQASVMWGVVLVVAGLYLAYTGFLA